LGLCGEGATDVVPRQRVDVPSELDKGEIHTASSSIMDKKVQEIVNIFYINENMVALMSSCT
jgi:hypothetical protein